MNHRHATDRKDWKVVAECPNNGDCEPLKGDPDDCEHLSLEASATNSEMAAREAIPIEECPVCSAELDLIVQEQPTEVLK